MKRLHRPLFSAFLAASAVAACSREPAVVATRTVEIPVGGMTCTGCESTIGSAVRALPGVDACAASFAKARVEVTYEPARIDEARIAGAIRAAGYEIAPVEHPPAPRPIDVAPTKPK